MHVDRPFRDRQTEPGPATLARAGIIEPEESVENPLSIRSANTRTLIDELDDSLVAVAPHANVNGGSCRTVFDGVVQQVGDRLADHKAINGGQRLGRVIDSDALIALLRKNRQ